MFALLLAGTLFAAGAAPLVTVHDEHRQCAKKEDCTFVRVQCGGCDSCGQPVRWIHRKTYKSQVQKLCADDKGPQCDAKACEYKMACVDGLCRWVEH